MNVKHALLPILLIILASCTFSEESDAQHDKVAIPSLILENATYSLGQSGENPISITSDRITFFSNDNRAIIENFSFRQIDEDGSISIEGCADMGILNTKTKAMDLEGNVMLIQHKEEMEISTDMLYFSPNDEEISSEASVMIKSKSGDFSGSGFFGDLKEQTYSFVSLEKGNIVL